MKFLQNKKEKRNRKKNRLILGTNRTRMNVATTLRLYVFPLLNIYVERVYILAAIQHKYMYRARKNHPHPAFNLANSTNKKTVREKCADTHKHTDIQINGIFLSNPFVILLSRIFFDSLFHESFTKNSFFWFYHILSTNVLSFLFQYSMS